VIWLAEHEPDVRARVATVLLPKDYLRFVDTGEKGADMSDAAGAWWLDEATLLIIASDVYRAAPETPQAGLRNAPPISRRTKSHSCCDQWAFPRMNVPPVPRKRFIDGSLS